MTATSGKVLPFRRGEWIQRDGGWSFVAPNADTLAHVAPTSIGTWSFATAYLRGSCENEASAKAAALENLDNPNAVQEALNDLSDAQRDVVNRMMEHYVSLSHDRRKAFMGQILEIIGADNVEAILKSPQE